MKKKLWGSQKAWLVKEILRGRGDQLIHVDYPVDLEPRYILPDRPHELIQSELEMNRKLYTKKLQVMLTSLDGLGDVPMHAAQSDGWYWLNDWLPTLDALSLFHMIREKKPHRYVEIGSGVSTEVVNKAKQIDGLGTKIVSIDPDPRMRVEDLVDRGIRERLEDIDLSLFDSLKAGDVVFMDGSHVGLMNTDVSVFFLEVLPRLSKGVIVQVHDIYWPYDYPLAGMSYNEQYMLGMYVLYSLNPSQIIFPVYYVQRTKNYDNLRKKIADRLGVGLKKIHGGSFWFEIG